MKVLHLTLKKKWFDMILSGEKKEEYRDYSDYWLKRLSNFFDEDVLIAKFKHFDIIRFRNGYAADAPAFDIECRRIKAGKPRHEWSDKAQGTHIVILLGSILTPVTPFNTLTKNRDI